jgi:hypothetical protein
LGVTEGPPAAYHWPATSLLPSLVPWLAILALLALKPNRGWSAWWIWVPLACLAIGWHWLQRGSTSGNSILRNDVLDALFDIPRALAFGVAALWLLAPYLGRRDRFRTALGMVFVVAVFGAFSCAVTAGVGKGAVIADVPIINNCFAALAGLGVGVAQTVLLALLAVVVTAAMVLSGFACRGRYRPFRLCLWLCVALLIVVSAAGVLLNALGLVTPNVIFGWGRFFVFAIVVAMVNYATLLPFLILSWASPFFRERIRALLHVRPEAPPAVDAAAHLSAVPQCDGMRLR